ncbi:hypothetical protein EDM56_08560 [Brevibacillus fluminis]|uniref:PPM-type phosphatase domain-containing protein n=1 Tax=Brevibacillus fluminis TaxID=511487 RepID=A0A3M8DQZ1_9BACL|nr:PP2C family protein-serine/threonine phosphatase [Brevibacillus fluminis]RNB90546.1 hypothetical protein EDM56_08560 [Brevibacillus fluminis]
MIGAYILYLLSLVLAILLLLSSHHLTTYKRWFDPAFLLGLALFTWGIGHLFIHHDNFYFQIIAQPFTFFFYVFLLLMFQTFPLLPNLYFERWKKFLDLFVLLLLYGTVELTTWYYPSLEEQLRILLQVHTGIFVLGIGCVVLFSNRHGKLWERANWLIIGTLMFLGVQTIYMDKYVTVACVFTLVSFAMIIAGYKSAHTEKIQVAVMDEYFYYHERMQFLLREENMNRLLIGISLICLVVMKNLPPVYLIGMALVATTLCVRLFISRRLNQVEIKEIFEISRNLEKRFEVHVKEITAKNEELTWFLDIKQRYETLLVETNAQSMKEVNYENVHQFIGEIVRKWFRTMNALRYLRIALQTAEGEVTYEISYGQRQPDKDLFKIEIETSIAHTTGVVIAEAISESEQIEEEELQQSFLRLLVIHVRGLLDRCLQNQQSLELRLVEQEMEFAAKIQFSLIPKERLIMDDVQAKVVYLPAAYVGGDYVDFIQLDSRYSCFLIADISGHGIPASLLTTGLRNSFRAVLQTCRMPNEILGRLNYLMYDDLSKTRSFITMIVAVYDAQQKTLWTSRAGHPEPYYFSVSKTQILPCSNGMGLGFNKFAVYPQDEWKVEEDFTLLMYTDGLINLGEDDRVMYSGRWQSTLADTYADAERDGHDRIEAIEQKIWTVARKMQQDDDISILILDFKAAADRKRD